MALHAIARKTHWLGVAFLFIASILLLVVTISAPIWNTVGLLKVHINNGTSTGHNSTISFGTFGYCILRAGPLENSSDYCSGRHVGYEPAHVISAIDHTPIGEIAAGTSDSLTRAMVLHAVACVLTFTAWLTSLGAGIFGSMISVLIAAVAWVVSLIVLACDLSLWSILRHHVNGDRSGSRAEYGSGIWMLLVSFVLISVGMVVVLFTCFATRREKRAKRGLPKEEAPVGVAPARKKRLGLW